jgi:uncharacterized surface anchored protein
MARDKGLRETLIPNGYIPFEGTDIDYDPVCFDMSSRKNRDYRVVDQEEILCNYRVKVVSELRSSRKTIERAEVVRKPKTFAEWSTASEKKKGPEVIEARRVEPN